MDLAGVIAIILGVVMFLLWRRSFVARQQDWRTMLQAVPITPDRLTKAYCGAMREHPSVKSATAANAFDVEVTLKDGTDTRNNLENLWREVNAAPDEAVQIINRHLRAVDQTKAAIEMDVVSHTDSVVAIIRDEQYVQQASHENTYCERLVGDLYIIYALDLPDVIRQLNKDEITKLGLADGALRELSVRNLLLKTQKIEVMGDGPVKMVICGGDYESSLLLVPDFWAKISDVITGDIVACIPCRDLLYFTGSKEPDGLRLMRELAEKMVNEGHHSISATFVTLQDGQWRVFKQSGGL
jgi:uncharacterized protein YtpQ (UPF0354 family)